ncbi:MAG: amidohydrolase family protein [Candidatus Aenigmarchaeota archaeon]|nr:amidohydrolase family protein [Candidatus Aenigmarchaeota archaeon]
MLIKNARFIVTQNKERQIIENKDILISENKIIEIGNKLSKDDEVINASNKIVIPGLINSHIHSPMILFRGISDEKDLHGWLDEEIAPVESRMNEEKAYYGTLLSILEQISTGTTTFNEMYSFTESIIRAVNKSGIRAFIGKGLRDGNNPEKADDEIKKYERIIQMIKRNKGLIKPVLGLHWTLTCSDELIKKLIEMNRENFLINMHVSETRREFKENLRIFKKRPIERLKELGLLNENFVAIHCIYVSEGEINDLARMNCKVVHNPTTNMKLVDGICPVAKMLTSGVNVSIGSDSPASNDNLNMFEEMKITSLLQRINTKRANAITSQTAFDLSTTNAAKTLDMENEIGSIDIGKKADIVFINKDEITINPILGKNGLLSNLIYSFDGRVSDVMVNGKFLLKDYEFLTLDKNAIIEKIRELNIY